MQSYPLALRQLLEVASPGFVLLLIYSLFITTSSTYKSHRGAYKRNKEQDWIERRAGVAVVAIALFEAYNVARFGIVLRQITALREGDFPRR